MLKIKILPTWRYLIVMTGPTGKNFLVGLLCQNTQSLTLVSFQQKLQLIKNGPYSAVHTPVYVNLYVIWLCLVTVTYETSAQ